MQALISHATDAMNKKDWPQAVRRWQKVFMTFKDQTPPEAYVLLSMAHRFQGQFEQAEAIIANGMKILPVNISILSEYAEIAKAKKDWPEVAKRLELIKAVSEQQKKLQTIDAQAQVDLLHLKLYSYGFMDRALADLRRLVSDYSSPILRRLAAWEIAVWHANQFTELDARECLQMLAIATNGEECLTKIRQSAILEAESYAILSDVRKSRQILEQALAKKVHVDIYLAMANLEEDIVKKTEWINKILNMQGHSKIDSLPFGNSQFFKNVKCSNKTKLTDNFQFNSKVSVILPAFETLNLIQSSIESILSQTWYNLEILVVYDCASDETISCLQDYTLKDPRIRLIKGESSKGIYIARNLALRRATGEFVICQEAEEWSHPEKIETQANHLIRHAKFIGNISKGANVTTDFNFSRNGKPGSYISSNMSSFMFRREAVLESIGFWDSVMLGADKEFIMRINKVFGKKSVYNCNDHLFSFILNSQNSLLRKFKNNDYSINARNEYLISSSNYHESTESLIYNFPQKNRPFPVPGIIVPKNEVTKSTRKHFDVIIASQFKIHGGNNYSIIEEIKANNQLGLSTGIIQLANYDSQFKRNDQSIRDVINGTSVQMITFEEKVSCDLLIVRYPPVLNERQFCIPDVQAKDVRIIANIPPMRTYGREREVRYDIKRCNQILFDYFGQSGTWHPIGPLVRKSLCEHHADDLSLITLSEYDWVNIINIDDWKRSCRPSCRRIPCVGKHGRDHYVKWPNNMRELLSVYPDSDEYEVRILGGAEIPKRILGGLPSNWKVWKYGELHPKDFLSQLDVFIHYTHPDWVEAFGRTILEAMAVGVPVILPPEYRRLFGNAAVYAHPSAVTTCIDELINDSLYYDRQVQTALDYVQTYFSYTSHLSRLQAISADVKTGFKK